MGAHKWGTYLHDIKQTIYLNLSAPARLKISYWQNCQQAFNWNLYRRKNGTSVEFWKAAPGSDTRSPRRTTSASPEVACEMFYVRSQNRFFKRHVSLPRFQIPFSDG